MNKSYEMPKGFHVVTKQELFNRVMLTIKN